MAGCFVVTQRFIEEARGIVGAEYVIHHPDDLLVYEYDGSVDRNIPQAVVLPNSTEEVSRVMAPACREGAPVTGRRPSRRGRGSGRKSLFKTGVHVYVRWTPLVGRNSGEVK
jgi:hypothetical protein